jgi:hypothetical protein
MLFTFAINDATAPLFLRELDSLRKTHMDVFPILSTLPQLLHTQASDHNTPAQAAPVFVGQSNPPFNGRCRVQEEEEEEEEEEEGDASPQIGSFASPRANQG